MTKMTALANNQVLLVNSTLNIAIILFSSLNLKFSIIAFKSSTVLEQKRYQNQDL